MKVEVHHMERGMRPEGPFIHVANINVPDGFGGPRADAALEYAYRAAQNIEGSWSMGARLPDPHGRTNADDTPVTWANPDYNANVEVLVELPVHNGKTFGIRSSMVGDRFIIDGETYVVASFGFEKVET